jgi:hypothetical protein
MKEHDLIDQLVFGRARTGGGFERALGPEYAAKPGVMHNLS